MISLKCGLLKKGCGLTSFDQERVSMTEITDEQRQYNARNLIIKIMTGTVNKDTALPYTADQIDFCEKTADYTVLSALIECNLLNHAATLIKQMPKPHEKENLWKALDYDKTKNKLKDMTRAPKSTSEQAFSGAIAGYVASERIYWTEIMQQKATWVQEKEWAEEELEEKRDKLRQEKLAQEAKRISEQKLTESENLLHMPINPINNTLPPLPSPLSRAPAPNESQCKKPTCVATHDDSWIKDLPLFKLVRELKTPTLG